MTPSVCKCVICNLIIREAVFPKILNTRNFNPLELPLNIKILKPFFHPFIFIVQVTTLEGKTVKNVKKIKIDHLRHTLMDNCNCIFLNVNNINYRFLPPYSPQLNPIEQYFSHFKAFLRQYIQCQEI